MEHCSLGAALAGRGPCAPARAGRRASLPVARAQREGAAAGWPAARLDPAGDPQRACGLVRDHRRAEYGASVSACRARGLRLRASVPHGHWKQTTLVAGLRTAGISVPYVFEGAINGQRFRAYIEQMLAPTLAPGDIVLLDNLRSHKVAGIAEAITARGAHLIYLPPYSPDLNPIEQAFAKYKALLRKAAERTVESLWQTIGRIADLFSPAECRNFFNSAGYAT